MSHAATDSASVVSPNIYSLIATSPRLRRMLLPEGILASPYEVLDYDATLLSMRSEGGFGMGDRFWVYENWRAGPHKAVGPSCEL